MLAVVETHPIQYHAPVYRALAQRHGVPVTAVYGSDFSVEGYRDEEFGETFKWDVDLLSGYSSVFLSRVRDGGPFNVGRVRADGVPGALRRLRPAAVLVVGYSPRFHRHAWMAAWRSGARVIFRGETNDESRSRGWLTAQARSAALRVAYRSCARLLYIGQRSRQHFERLGVAAERMIFSPYCVDLTPFDTAEAARERWRAEAREAMRVAPGQRLILFSGKLSERKGVDLLVEAIRQLPASERDRHVVVCLGDGSLRGRLERLAAAAPQVELRILGFRNQRALSPVYHAADLLVLPSRRSETWGLVVNEALHHGLPCVVSDRVGCAPDLILPGVTGEVCRADSAEDLARAVHAASLLGDSEQVRRRCREHVAQYSVDAAAGGIARAYYEALAPGKAA